MKIQETKKPTYKQVTFSDFNKILKNKACMHIDREQWDSLPIWEWLMKSVNTDTWEETIFVKVTCHVQEIELQYSNTWDSRKWKELLISSMEIPQYEHFKNSDPRQRHLF